MKNGSDWHLHERIRARVGKGRLAILLGEIEIKVKYRVV